MAYTPQTWADGDNTKPLSAARMTYMETGIDQAHDGIMPTGGSTGQVLTKNSGTNYDAGWAATTAQRPVFLQVASNDAPTDFKNSADYVCDGTADQTEINTALNRAAPLVSRNSNMLAGAEQLGKVLLSGGRFNCSGSINIPTGVHFQGVGWLSEVRAVSCNSVGLLMLRNVSDHLVQVSEMFLYGNYSAGGTCNGIDFDMTSSTNAGVSAYPSSSPDSYHHIHDLYIDAFSSGTRHGIRLWATSTANNRGNIIDRCQIRNISGDGIHLSAASDSFIANTHIGTVGGSGFRIATGNCKVVNCKSFYCDTYGLYATSGRGTLTAFESQDDATGLYFDASPWSCSSITADTSSVAGVRVGSGQLTLSGLAIYLRGGGRYATQGIGLHIDAAHTDLTLIGNIVPTSITTPISGSAGARSFVRVSNGTTLVSVG